MANLCREAALGPIRSIADIQCVDADQVIYLCHLLCSERTPLSILDGPFSNMI